MKINKKKTIIHQTLKHQALQPEHLHPCNPPSAHIRVAVCLSDVVTVTHVVETTPQQPKQNPARRLRFALPLLLFSYPP